MPNIKERVLHFSKQQGIGIENFLASIGMTYGSFKGEAKKRSLNSDAIEKILTTYPTVNPIWLLTGIGEMELNPESNKNKDSKTTVNNEIIITPLISKYFQKEFIDNIYNQDYIKSLNKVPWINDFGTDPMRFMTFEIKGDKMDDNSPQSFLDGDLVLGMKIEKMKWDNLHKPKSSFIFLHKEKGVIVCRIINYEEENQFYCHYLNDMYKDFELKKDNIFSIYKIMELRREPRF